MRRHLFCLLLGTAFVAPQPGWAASSSDYAGPCQSESTAAGSPRFLSVDVRTKPTDARIINLTAPGRFRLGISCVYTEFKLTRLGDGNLVVYAPGGQPLWASNTSSGDPPNVSYRCVQGDGNVVVYKWPRPVRATNTAH
jgi:hypothetical protein